jgi:hypothetical protein
MTVTMKDGTLADLAIARSILVEQTTSLTVQNQRPLIIAVLGTVDIQGKILVQPGTTGGFASGNAPGPGVSLGTGGGSYCGTGGAGGPTPQAPGGSPYGTPELIPLVGGSAGGNNGSTNACGGAGGGVIQIVAGTSIIIRSLGAVSAGGGGNVCGGGSGGAILLEAPSVSIEGNVTANSGGGGFGGISGAEGTPDNHPAAGGYDADGMGGNGSAVAVINGGDGSPGGQGASGGGGAGRIRINTSNAMATVTGIVSPDLTTACATQGMIH